MKTSTQTSLRRSVAVASFLVVAGSLFLTPTGALRGEGEGEDCGTSEDCERRCGPPQPDGPDIEDEIRWQQCRASCLQEILQCQSSPDSADSPGRGPIVLPDVLIDTPPAVVIEGEGETSSGDTNGDGIVDLSDAVRLLNYLFLGGEAPATILIHGFARVEVNPQRSLDGKRLLIGGDLVLSSGDADGNGELDMSDAIRILQHLFSDGTAPVEIVAESPLRQPPPGSPLPIPYPNIR